MSTSRTEAARRAEAERRAREGRTEAQKAATAKLVAARKAQAEQQRSAKQAVKELPPMPSDADEEPGLRVRDAAYPSSPPRPPAPQDVAQDVTQDVVQDVPAPTVTPEKPVQMTNNEPKRNSTSLLARVLGTGENHGRAAKR